MKNYYAEPGTDLEKMLHGASRLHVSLGRMDEENISTRGWKFNELVDGILAMNSTDDEMIRQDRSIKTLFDTLDAMTEIGPNAIFYLTSLGKYAT